MSIAVREPPSTQDIDMVSDASAIPSPQHEGSWRHFWRHFLEMSLVMGAGMFAFAFLFMVSLNLVVEREITWEEALVNFPEHTLLAVAIGMSLPMIPWMRHRGHSKRSAHEMAAVMAALVIPFVCLALLNVVDGAQCGLYCAAGFIGMFALMLYRRADYLSEPGGRGDG
jgi:flagellar biosynthetic protein FliP